MVKLYAPGTRKGNRTYIARGYVAGQQFEINTHATNARAAQRAWLEFRTKAFADRKGREPRRGAPTLFADAIAEYIAARRPSARDQAFLARISSDTLANMRLEDVRPVDIQTAANRLYPNNATSTRNRAVIVPGAAVLHFANRNEWIPYRVVEKFREPEPEARRPAESVRDQVIANAEGSKRLLLLCLFFQGWRITEALGLRWDKVDLTAATVQLYVSKSRKWQSLPLHDEFRAALANASHDSSEVYVFPWRTRSGVYKWLRPLRNRLGVRFTPHMARHDFGGRLRELGATGRDLVDVGSWTSERSVARYMSASSEHGRAIMRRLTTGGTNKGS